MKILFNGCSWTYGGELKDIVVEDPFGAGHELRIAKRYSRLVSEHFGAHGLGSEEVNIADNGISNEKIIRQLLNPKQPKTDFDLIVIQMTYPARTEYHTGKSFFHNRRRQTNSGWIQISPNYSAYTLMKYKDSDEDTVHKVGSKEGGSSIGFGGKQHLKFWNDYYRVVTTKEFFDHKEMIQKITIENYCKVHNIPLVLCTLNQETQLDFDVQMNFEGLPVMPGGHPNVEGHRMIADKIIEVAESRL